MTSRAFSQDFRKRAHTGAGDRVGFVCRQWQRAGPKPRVFQFNRRKKRITPERGGGRVFIEADSFAAKAGQIFRMDGNRCTNGWMT